MKQDVLTILLRGQKVMDINREEKCMTCVPQKAPRLRLKTSSRNVSAYLRLNDQSPSHMMCGVTQQGIMWHDVA